MTESRRFIQGQCRKQAAVGLEIRRFPTRIDEASDRRARQFGPGPLP